MKICTCQQISASPLDCPLHGEMLREKSAQEALDQEHRKAAHSHAEKGGS